MADRICQYFYEINLINVEGKEKKYKCTAQKTLISSCFSGNPRLFLKEIKIKYLFCCFLNIIYYIPKDA